MQQCLTFFVMSYKGLEVLRTVASRHRSLIHRVVVARDPHVQEDYFTAICSTCDQYKITWAERHEAGPCTTPYGLAISWRWLIDTADTELIVFHDSLLPRYRGFNPLVSCLLNGEPQIGVTALFAEAEYDAGDIIGQRAVAVQYPLRIAEAIEKVTEAYTELAAEVCGHIASNQPLPRKVQDPAAATFSLWRDEDDYRIDWLQSAEQVRRHIDAVGFPYKGASAIVNSKLVRILAAENETDLHIENRCPGKVIRIIDSCPIVVCGEGLVRITECVDEDGNSLLPLKNFRTRFR